MKKATYALLVVLLLATLVSSVVATKKVREAAVENLARQQAEKERDAAQGELERLTQDANPRIRQKAIELLQEYRPETATKLCGSLLKQEKDAAVAIALLNLAGAQKVTPAFDGVLFQYANTLELRVRAKAAWAFGEMAGGLSQEQRNKAGKAMAHSLALRTPDRPEEERFHDVDPALMLACVDAIGKIGYQESAAIVASLLQPTYPLLVRRAAIRSLAGLADLGQSTALQAAWKLETDSMMRTEIERILSKEPFCLVVNRKKGIFEQKDP